MASLAKQVCEILNNPSLGKLMNFSICGLHVRSSNLTEVAKAIKAGKVQVVDSGTDSGSYNPETDILKVCVPLTEEASKAVVVHEALHCAQDIRGMFLVRMDDETAGFIGHGIYLRAFDSRYSPGTVYKSNGSLLSNMVEALMPVVDLVMGGSKVPADQIANLQDKIVALPDYANSRETMIFHNGLKKM